MSQNLFGIKLGQINAPAECVAMGDSCHRMGGGWRFARPRLGEFIIEEGDASVDHHPLVNDSSKCS